MAAGQTAPAAYGIDASRIVLGGVVGRRRHRPRGGRGRGPDPGRPAPGTVSPAIAAGVSTGAHLTPGLAGIDLAPIDAPVMMFHYDQDTPSVLPVVLGGRLPDLHGGAGVGQHLRLRSARPAPVTRSRSALMGPWWAPEIGPFLWAHLDLAGAT